MLVVGSRGAGGVRGLVLGSVNQHLVRHSPCTTIVTHAPTPHGRAGKDGSHDR
ncbi:universal stress protein [Spirillospora sp. NPDC047279]|uniref:universal stress protein n=1 Tax=Spirillospora sp. NPDC047279 TaxID=3155478 RepID=UPI0033FB2FD5